MYSATFVILIITFLLNLSLATMIIRRGRLGLWFGLIIYCIAFWNLTLIMFYFLVPWEAEVSTFQQLYFWGKLALIGPIIIPVLYFHFALQQTQKKKYNLFLYLTFLPPIVLLLFVPSKFNWGFIYFSDRGVPTSSGWDIALYLPFTIYFLAYLSTAFWILSKNLKNLASRTATQIRYVLFGSVVTAAVAITSNSILPMINRDFYTQIVGPVTSIIFSLSVAYAILKHRFMDIRVVINKSVVYIMLTAIFLGLTTFFALILGNSISNTFSTNILLSAGIVAAVIALAFPFLYTIVQLLVDKIIWRPNANYPKILMVSEYTLAR